MALEAGTLRVTLQYAKDIKDCDWFGRQDPYVRLRVGGQERCSRMVRDGGRNPVWDETFEFSVLNENTLELTLMDEDTLKRDDLIGVSTVSLARVREQGSEVVQAPVSRGRDVHKQQGFVQLSLSFVPNSRLRPSAAGYGVPYGVYGAAPAPAVPYSYPAPAYGGCAHAAAAAPAGPYPPPAPYDYGYPPQYGPSYGPPPSYSYGPAYAAPVPTSSAPPAPSPACAPPYGAPAPSYYPPVPQPPPAYGSNGAAGPYYSR